MPRSRERRKRLRQLLSEPSIIIAPGAADALTARIIQEVGFQVLYVTGAGISNRNLGYPDVGLATMTEVLEQSKNIANCVAIPVIADADNGYGNAINVIRTVRDFENAGLSGIQIEDQIIPKRCGHFEGKAVVEKEEMVNKVRAALEAKEDPDFIIIARTDAGSVNGLEDALERGREYAQAGADMVFVEAPKSVEELKLIAQSIHAPLVANMVEGVKTPLVSAKELEQMGYKMVIYANTALRVAAKATMEALRVLMKEGTTVTILDRMISWEERQKLVGLPEIQQLERRYL